MAVSCGQNSPSQNSTLSDSENRATASDSEATGNIPENSSLPDQANRTLASDSDRAGKWETETIAAGTQAHIDDVAIGAGNFWDEYEGGDGNKEPRQSAGLWISVKDDSAANRTIRVSKGSKFSAGRFNFEVLEVTDNVIRLRFR